MKASGPILVLAVVLGVGSGAGCQRASQDRDAIPGTRDLAARASSEAGTAAVAASPGTSIEAQVSAAQSAADETWLTLQAELCGPAVGPAAPPPQYLAAPRTSDAQLPRARWNEDPARVFDNLYLFPTGVVPPGDVNAWAIRTSAGIILIDTTFAFTVKDVLVEGMRKVGLDPAEIKYIILTHGHSDHVEGAKSLQDAYGPRVLLSEVDWTLLASPRPPGGGSASVWPKKDMVLADGQQLTLGDTTVTLYLTPGHTMGTASVIIPVTDKGQPHVALLWGGTAVRVTSPYDNIVAYSASARRMQDLAAKAGVDVLLSNHERFYDQNKRLNVMRSNPAAPNPFIVGPAKARDFLAVLDHCTQALALASAAKSQ